MKTAHVSKLVAIAIVAALSSPALAQMPPQQPAADPQIAIYRNLLDEANSRYASILAQAQKQVSDDQKEIADLRTQVENSQKQVKTLMKSASPDAPAALNPEPKN